MIKFLEPRLAEIGKIKIGGKGERVTSQGGKTFCLPEKYDHFVITTNSKDKDGKFIVDEKVMKELKPNPRELDIILLFDDIEKNFRTSLALYTGKSCRCRGDGEKAERLIEVKDEKTGEIDFEKKSVACPCEYLEGEGAVKGLKCKPAGNLICLFSEMQRIGGVYCFRTSSWNTIRNIMTSMAFIRQSTGGILAGLPLKLTIKPQSAQEKDSGKTHIIYVVNLEFDGKWQALRNTAIEIAKVRATSQIELTKYLAQAQKYLEIPETEEEEKDVTEEFHPENVSKPVPAEFQVINKEATPEKVQEPSKSLTAEERKNIEKPIKETPKFEPVEVKIPGSLF